jgi:Sulfotransferase domain
VVEDGGAEIASRLPQARIIMVLRSPAERAFSRYLHYVSDGFVTQSFRDYVRATLRHRGEGLGIHGPFLEMGFYSEQLQRYLKCFPREQIGIWFYEEATLRPREFMREVLKFLEVDSAFAPNTSKHYNQPQIARMVAVNQVLRRLGVWQRCKRITPAPVKSLVRNAVYRPTGSLKLAMEDRTWMLDFYRSDIHRLEGILGRDLGAWLA